MDTILISILFSKNIFLKDLSTLIPKTREDFSTQIISKNELVQSIQKESLLKETTVHIETPSEVRGIYFTGWAAGSPVYQRRMLELIRETNINSVVIDIKDATGRLSYIPNDPTLQAIGSGQAKIKDIKKVLQELHNQGIYVIGRVSVFQDPYFVKKHPEYGVLRKSDKTSLWQDHKGIRWLDASETAVWDYVISIADDAYTQGFDEINFDYVRFPSDGDMKDLYFPKSDGLLKKDVMKNFFSYLRDNTKHKGYKISADVFGITTSATTDIGIGQDFSEIMSLVDYISPMIYPSHYGTLSFGFKNPAEFPGEVVNKALSGAIEKAKATGQDPKKIRPWLQDFDLGARYTKELVGAQIESSEALGITSWLMWDPKNIYTKDAFKKEYGLPNERVIEHSEENNPSGDGNVQ